jgi:hypothetical protein
MAPPPLALGDHGSSAGAHPAQPPSRSYRPNYVGAARTNRDAEVRSRCREAADMAEVRERRAYSTADTYSSCLTNQVLPQLGEPGSSSVMSPSSTRSSPACSGPGESSSSTTAQPPRSCATPPTPAA